MVGVHVKNSIKVDVTMSCLSIQIEILEKQK